jgi:hypothetical protein
MAHADHSPLPDQADQIELQATNKAPADPDPNRLRSLARLCLRLAREDSATPASPGPAGLTDQGEPSAGCQDT